MCHVRSWRAYQVAAIMAAMWAGSLRTAHAQTAAILEGCRSLETESADEPLQLVACMLDEEVRPGDPIRMFVALANVSNGPVLARARLDIGSFLLITVEDERGSQQDMWIGEPGHFGEDVTDVTIPRGGIVGRTIDLACDEGGYRSVDAQCFSELTVRDPGVYRVKLSYAVLCGQAGCPADHPWTGRLSVPRLEFRVLPNE